MCPFQRQLVPLWVRDSFSIIDYSQHIFAFFIATELLLVVVNSCLERHLPHGLLFVIANSKSILHVCLNVIAIILCSAWHKLLCLYLYSRFKSTLGLMLICCLCIYIPTETLNKIYLLTYLLKASLHSVGIYFQSFSKIWRSKLSLCWFLPKHFHRSV